MINSVRNAVLSVLNKNNYGYLSPADFNLFAQNSQMELYEEYFSNYNKVINAENVRTSGVDYADIEQPIAEVLEYFLRTDYLTPLGGGNFSMPTVSTTGYNTYMLLDIKCRTNVLKTGLTTSINANQLIDSTGNFITNGVSAGDIVANITTGLVSTVVSVVSNTTLLLSSNIFLAVGNGYAVIAQAGIVESEKVSNAVITLLNNSNLTPPSNQYPAYILKGETITMYPKAIAIKGQVEATYFRYPKPPKWTYITLANGEPVFDQSQSDYQDFELPTEDEYKLVTKILEYAGMTIRETEVTQFGMTEQQHEQPTFSMQQ